MEVEREDFWSGADDARLLARIDPGATSLTVTAGGLATWGPVVHGKFSVILSRTLANEEHVYATGIAGDQITGLTGVTQSHEAGETVEHGLRASHVDQPNEFLSMPQAKGDMPVATAADTWDRFPVGADGTVLVADSAQGSGLRWSASPALSPSSLILPTSTTPAQTADASMVWDSDSDLLTVGTGAGRKTMVDTDSVQTMTNKTLTSSVLSGGGNVIEDAQVNLDGGIFVFPHAAVPAQTADGEAEWDTTNRVLTIGDGGSRKTLVDTATAQVLSNKNLQTPIIGSFANAQHGHTSAATGGTLTAEAIPAATPRGTTAVDDTFSAQSSTGSESAAILSVTFTAATGRRYRAMVSGVRLTSDTANDVGEIRIKNGGAIVQATARKMTAVGGAGATTADATGYLVGAGASVTLDVVVIRTQGAGTVSAEAGNGVPSLVVEDTGI